MNIDEAKALVILADSESIEEKARVCDRLAVVGGAKSVPVLASYLADPQMSVRARTALENIPDAGAGDALIKALGKLKGSLLLGVITSLGARKETDAVPQLCSMVESSDSAVGMACISALGQIANGEAVAKLRALMEKADENYRVAAAHASLAAAASLNGDDHAGLLKAVASAKVPEHIQKVAAK